MAKEITRITISFTKAQVAFLKKEADRLGVSIGEVVRQIIDRRKERIGK